MYRYMCMYICIYDSVFTDVCRYANLALLQVVLRVSKVKKLVEPLCSAVLCSFVALLAVLYVYEPSSFA